MSIVEIQEELEYWPDQKIQEEIMRPTGAANGQTYLVVLESERRTKERQAYENQMAQQEQPQMTVAEESAMELGGGIMDVDPNLMQNQMMAQQMPQQMQQQMQQQMPQQMPQGQPMAMYGGGAIRYQEGEDVELDESGWQYGPYGNKIVGRGGWLYDPTSVVDNALLAASAIPIGGRAVTGIGLGGKALIKGGKAGAKILGRKIAEKTAKPIQNILEGIGGFASKRGFLPSYAGQSSIPLAEVGGQALKSLIDPRKLRKLVPGVERGLIRPDVTKALTPFYSRTLPLASATAFISSRGEGDVQAEDVDETVTSEEIERLTAELDRLSNMSPAEIQAERDAEAADAEALVLQQLEKDRRAGMTEGGRFFEDAMKNIPEDETYQDYLSKLEGMEESSKGQVLMDLGSAIANAGHGGDIAKGIQEAGTKARTEKLALAKEKAGILSGKRADDINLALQIATLDTNLAKQGQTTLTSWLELFSESPEGAKLIESIDKSPDPIGEMISILGQLGVDTTDMKSIIEKTTK